MTRTNSLFPTEENETKVLENLRQQEEKLRQKLEEFSTRHARLGAFEWRYEFPEIIDEKGNFVGFDCIIGNPPYGVAMSNEYRKTVEEKIEHVPDYEIYYYFILLGKELLKIMDAWHTSFPTHGCSISLHKSSETLSCVKPSNIHTLGHY